MIHPIFWAMPIAALTALATLLFLCGKPPRIVPAILAGLCFLLSFCWFLKLMGELQ